jgi:hypothetical protein
VEGIILLETLASKILLVVVEVLLKVVVKVLRMYLVVPVVLEKKYQDGLFHHLMEHQVLHPVDSLLVEVVEHLLQIQTLLLVLVDVVVVVLVQRRVLLE